MRRMVLSALASLMFATIAKAQNDRGDPNSSSSGLTTGDDYSTESGSGVTTGTGSTAMNPNDTHSIMGNVKSIDTKKNTLTLEDSPKTFKIDSSSQIVKNGNTAALSDVKEGDKVQASYSGSGGTVHVQGLNATTPSGGNPTSSSNADPSKSSGGTGSGSSDSSGSSSDKSGY